MNAFEYLPHRAPALLVTAVLEASPQGSVCLAEVPKESPFVEDSSFPAYLALEMGAQSAAAGEASQQTGTGGEPQAGFVVRIARARFALARLPLDREYRVVTELARAAPPLRTWACRVELDGQVVVEAEISTFAGGTDRSTPE